MQTSYPSEDNQLFYSALGTLRSLHFALAHSVVIKAAPVIRPYSRHYVIYNK